MTGCYATYTRDHLRAVEYEINNRPRHTPSKTAVPPNFSPRSNLTRPSTVATFHWWTALTATVGTVGSVSQNYVPKSVICWLAKIIAPLLVGRDHQACAGCLTGGQIIKRVFELYFVGVGYPHRRGK